MASGVLSGQREELGSGGKIIRGRRRLLSSFSPYSRPPSSAALIPHSVPEAQTGRNHSWLSGLISGVGKLFLSVLGSEDSSPSLSECFSNSDEYYDYSPNEHEDQLRSDDLTAFKMRESEAERNAESLAIFPKSETKLVIEQLLMQETFTSDECKKLVEIIQSRVPDRNSVEIGEGTQNLYGISKFSPRIPASFSPRFYAQEAVFPDLRNKAVMEAKKWFEEKKLSPSPTYDRSYGPCILNTRMNQYGFEEDVDSPIEMAKSYMQSLPPWRSPSFSTNGLKTSPSRGNNTCKFGSPLLPTSEVKKRDYLSIGSFCSEENHRTNLKLLDNEQEFSKLGQSMLLSRLSVHEALTVPSEAAAKTFNEVQDGNAAGAYQLMETDNGISVGVVLQPKEVFKEKQEEPKVAGSNNIEQLHYDIVNILPKAADMSVPDVSQNVEMPLPTEEQIDSISDPQDSLVFASMADGNNGDFFPETETLQLKNITPTKPSINKYSGDEVKFPVINSMQVDFDFTLNNTHPITTDSELPYENPETHEEVIESGEKFETSSNLAEMKNMKSELESMINGDPTATSSVSISEGDIFIGIRRRTRANTNANNMKPVEPPQPGRGNKRKPKKVGKQKKWKG